MRAFYAMAAAAVVLVPAAGQAAEDSGRYRLEKSADGYVRMDTVTGNMAICRENSDGLVCTPATDRNARRGEAAIQRLRERVDRLEAQVAALEGDGAVAGRPGLPSEEDFEKSMSYMERFFRRFMGVVEDLEKEDKSDPAPDTPPRSDRT